MAATGTIEAVRKDKPSASSRSPRLLALASDERLVKRVRGGSEEAFAALYERHQRKLLSFCRHMLGSQHEAEDALQQTFVNAYRDMLRGDKELRVRPWLYRIARNQCISMLRARRPEAELSPEEPSLRGLSEEVAGRSDLRGLLEDLACLPHDQREALVLAELHDNSHAEVAEILCCGRDKVKSLVFQARSSLLRSREARETSCFEVQRQLSVLRGGSLRRSLIRRHLKGCEACRHYYAEVKRQRAAIALILPVAPSAGLKFGASSALAAAKAGAGLAGGGSASAVVAGSAAGVAGGATPAASGSITALAAKLGVSGAAMKGTAAVVAVTAVAGGAAGVEVARHTDAHHPSPRVGAPAGTSNTTVEPPAATGASGPTKLPGRALPQGRHPVRSRARARQDGPPGQSSAHPRERAGTPRSPLGQVEPQRRTRSRKRIAGRLHERDRTVRVPRRKRPARRLPKVRERAPEAPLPETAPLSGDASQ